MTTIIVAEEKHGTRYLDASTDEQWARSALALLTERFEQGYWYYDPREDRHPMHLERVKERDELAAMTDEQIDALPETLHAETRSKRSTARRAKSLEAREELEYDRIKQVVEEQVLAFSEFCNSRTGEVVRREPTAWVLLDARSDHEYEHVELVDVEAPGAD